MFTLWGAKHRFCDRINRRDFLQVGALGVGGLTLADVLRLRAETPARTAPRAVIMICLAGGPSHLDMYDMKPDAPADYRGEFKPIATNVPGFDICEHMPMQARIADKLALVRTVQFVEPMQHELEEVYTGFPKAAQRPSFGSVISRFRGADSKLPSYVSLDYNTGTAAYESPQYVGAAHRPLQLAGTAGVQNLSLTRGVTPARLDDRRGLMQAFDGYRREVDAQRESQDMDAYTSRAFDIITSPKAREAFDLSREPDKVRDRYGSKDDKYIYVGTQAGLAVGRPEVSAGAPVGRGRRAGGDAAGGRLGPPRQRRVVAGRDHFRQPALDAAAAGPVDPRPGHRPARAGTGQGSAGTGLGRVRPHAEDLAERPRPLAGRELCSLRRRGPHRPSGGRNRQPRRIGPRPGGWAPRTCSGRSITRWASTPRRSCTISAAGRRSCSTTGSRLGKLVG